MPAATKTHKPKTPPPQPPRVLVVDDEPNLVEVIGDVVGRGMGCRVVTAANISQARKILASQPIELMVADLNLPDGDGMSLLPDLREHQPAAAAVVITGSPSVDHAIGALRGGAVDFVPKPFTRSQLTERIQKALDRQALLAQPDALSRLESERALLARETAMIGSLTARPAPDLRYSPYSPN